MIFGFRQRERERERERERLDIDTRSFYVRQHGRSFMFVIHRFELLVRVWFVSIVYTLAVACFWPEGTRLVSSLP